MMSEPGDKSSSRTPIRQPRRRRIALMLVIIGAAAAGVLRQSEALGASGNKVLYEENFSGKEAVGWQLGSNWEVTEYAKGKWALHGRGHFWARYTRGGWGDCILMMRLNVVEGSVHVNYRLGKRGTRYFVSFGPKHISLHKTPRPGEHVMLRSRSGRYSLRRAYWLTIAGQGGRLRVYVDGQLKISYTDPKPLPYGRIALETLDNSEVYVDAVKVLGRGKPTLALRWVRTGGPLGGLGYDVRMRPDKSDVVYVTDSWSGVNISADGGRTWRPSNDGIVTRAGPTGDAIPVFCLTIDPRDPNVIWVGTQNSRGIFKSTDAGKTWRKKDRGVIERSGITFRGLAVDPTDSDTVYAAGEVSSSVWAPRPQHGREFDLVKGVVYKTIDGGDNWAPIWKGNNLARYVCINPRDPKVLYVSTGIFDREAANSNHTRNLPGGVGILKSTNGGRTWHVLDHRNGLLNLYIGSLVMHPKNPDILLAGAGNNAYGKGSGAYLSKDGGHTWKRTLSHQGIHSVEFAASDARIAYAGNPQTIYRSKDGGTTWKPVTAGGGWGPPGVQAGFPIDIQIDPRNANRLFVNNYLGGNFLSADGGRTWKVASQGYTGAQVRDIAVDATDAKRVLAAARSGVFVSADSGGKWVGLSHRPAGGIEWYVVAIDPSDPKHLLGANNAQGVLFQSRNGGKSWRRVGERPGKKMSWRAIAFAPSDPKVVYAGTSAFFSAGTLSNRMAADGIHVSRDGGGTWRRANDKNSSGANVAAIAVDPKNANIVYAATCYRGILKSVNAGAQWRFASRGLGAKDTRALAINPKNPRLVYAGTENAGIYVSADGGASWRPSSRGMDPEASVRDIVIHPKDTKILYAADLRSGVYRSSDGGKSWTRINDGLSTRAVQALAISSDGSVVYAATEGGGVFRLDAGASQVGAGK